MTTGEHHTLPLRRSAASATTEAGSICIPSLLSIYFQVIRARCGCPLFILCSSAPCCSMPNCARKIEHPGMRSVETECDDKTAPSATIRNTITGDYPGSSTLVRRDEYFPVFSSFSSLPPLSPHGAPSHLRLSTLPFLYTPWDRVKKCPMTTIPPVADWPRANITNVHQWTSGEL